MAFSWLHDFLPMIFFHLSSTWLSDLYTTKNCIFCRYTTAEKLNHVDFYLKPQFFNQERLFYFTYSLYHLIRDGFCHAFWQSESQKNRLHQVFGSCGFQWCGFRSGAFSKKLQKCLAYAFFNKVVKAFLHSCVCIFIN